MFSSVTRSLYKPTDPSLGILERIPTEVRQHIFALVLDTKVPVRARRCCGLFKDNISVCNNHRRAPAFHQGRFALLYTSRSARCDASWVLHHKVMLQLDIHPSMLYYDLASEEGKSFRRLWLSAACYRTVNLNIPRELIHLFKPDNYTVYLRTAVENLVHDWNTGSSHASRPLRTVTINLGRMFDEEQPFNIPESASQILRMRSRQAWNNLERIIKLVATKGKGAEWTFTAMSEVDSKNKGGRDTLRTMCSWLEANNINFKGKSAEEVPRLVAIESKGATGGTHRRFVD